MDTEEMLKNIMENWYNSTEEFIKFEEEKGVIICAYAYCGDWGINDEDITLCVGKSYKEIFEEEFKEPIMTYINDTEGGYENVGYFTEEEYNFLLNYER